ncbi:MAG: hypothetical protein HZA24_04340 [Nitrospirae bacterium]|nr:hypothetical protein [Nitrospirota bacterium]
MSGMAILAFGVFTGLCLYGIAIGIKGALSEAPPYMQGVGQTIRHKLDKAA